MVKMVVENEYDETNGDEVNYKLEYRKLKRKLKLLIYVSMKIDYCFHPATFSSLLLLNCCSSEFHKMFGFNNNYAQPSSI